MTHSFGSLSESGVTVELGLASVREGAAHVREYGHSEVRSRSRGRGLIPKVQSVGGMHLSDQQVPVYWDQTVPVWLSSCKAADLASCKRKSAHPSSGSSSYGECCQTVYHRSTPGNRGNEEAVRRSGNAADVSSEVSFDDIMSMYKSSLM